MPLRLEFELDKPDYEFIEGCQTQQHIYLERLHNQFGSFEAMVNEVTFHRLGTEIEHVALVVKLMKPVRCTRVLQLPWGVADQEQALPVEE